MVKQFFASLCSMFILTGYVHAQTPDEQVKTLIHTEDYLSLMECLPDYKDSITPLVYHIGQAITLHYTMQYELSNQAIDSVLNNQTVDFDTRFVMSMLKAENYKGMKCRSEAIQTYNTLLKDLSYREHREEINEINRYKMAEMYSPDYPAIAVEWQPNKNRIPIQYIEKSIFVPVKGRKKEIAALFDTGATMNAISLRMAKQMKMKILNDSVQLSGTVNNAGWAPVALAQELTIGDISVKNIPFLIIDPIEHPENDQTDPIEMVIGFPVISALKHLRICRDEQTIEVLNPSKEKRPCNMLSVNGCPYIRLYSEKRPLTFVLDCGSSATWLTEKYYWENEAYIITHANPVQRELAGLGGSQYYTVFELTHFCIDIDNQPTEIGPIDVFTQIIPGFQQMPNDGLVGSDFFYRFKYITLDFNQMNISFDN